MDNVSYKRLFQETSFGVAVFDTTSLKLDMANGAMLELWGRDKSVLNLPLLDFMPEMEDQAYPMIMQQVAKSGKTFAENGAEILINKQGISESIFMDYSYTPIFGAYHTATSIMVIAKGICQKQINNLVEKGIHKNLQSMVLTAPVPMGVFTGINLEVRIVNNLMLDLWCGNEWFGKKELAHVYHNGVPYTMQIGNVIYSFSPLVDYFGNINGVTVIAQVK